MGYFRSQLFVNTESPTGYEYALNASDVDGTSVRTVGEDGRIGQFSAATFNKSVIIPSDTQRYIYTNGSYAFDSLPNYNSEIRIIGDGVKNFNNFNYIIYNCNNFKDKNIRISDFKTVNYGSQIVSYCPNWVGSIIAENINFANGMTEPRYYTSENGYPAPYYNLIYINCNNVWINGQTGSSGVNNIIADSCNYVYYNMRSIINAHSFIINNCNTAFISFDSSQRSAYYSTDVISITNSKNGYIYMRCWNNSNVRGYPNNIIIDNVANYSGSTIFHNGYYVIPNNGYINIRMTNVMHRSVMGGRCIFNQYNDYNDTLGRISFYFDNISGNYSLFTDVRLKSDMYINNLYVSNINGNFAVLYNLNFNYDSYLPTFNLSINFNGDIENNVKIWETNGTTSDIYINNFNIIIKANNIRNCLFNGSFKTAYNYGSLKRLIKVESGGIIQSGTPLLSYYGNNSTNTVFSNSSDAYMYFNVNDYFDACILGCNENVINTRSSNVYYCIRGMYVSVKFNTTDLITMGHLMSNQYSLFNVYLNSNNKTPSGINMFNLVNPNDNSVVRRFFCDSNIYDLMNNAKTRDSAFIPGIEITDWEDNVDGSYPSSHNAVYNSFYNIKIINLNSK